MPHAELKYSADLGIDAVAILTEVEAIIQTHDAGSGDCKGRAYPTTEYHHTHLLLEISMLPKAHRDKTFMDALAADLEAAVTARIPTSCFFSLAINFSGEAYVTRKHVVDGKQPD